MNRVLVVDDDQNILKVIKMRLEADGYHVTTAVQAEEAISLSSDHSFNLALVDLKLPQKDGIQVMRELQEIAPGLPVIILTAYGTIETAVEAMRRGASTYLTKPFDHRELLYQIRSCLAKRSRSVGVETFRRTAKENCQFKNIIGRSDKLKRVIDRVALAANSDSNVFIEGESGTGKELIARTLHMTSPRQNGPFVAINCAAIPETLLESELFGYKKGAFTGATASKRGLFVEAHRGSFFLDEICEMPLGMQAKLLRVFEEKEFYPLGEGKTTKIDVRLLASSNRDLRMEVEKGNFRQDLFYRVHVIHIVLPPLRERKEDIPLLARHFLKKYSERMGKNIKEFSTSALHKLMLHSWPGNVRELENTVESAVVMANQQIITEDFVLPRSSEKKGPESLRDAKDNFERNYLIRLMEVTRGNVSQAAKLAGKFRADLYELFRKHSIDPADFRKGSL